MHARTAAVAENGFPSPMTALNAVTVAFAKELAAFNITVNAADPG